jgi:hypothetical protein
MRVQVTKKVKPEIMKTQTATATDAWTTHIYLPKSPISEQKYPPRLAKFFSFAGLPQEMLYYKLN